MTIRASPSHTRDHSLISSVQACILDEAEEMETIAAKLRVPPQSEPTDGVRGGARDARALLTSCILDAKSEDDVRAARSARRRVAAMTSPQSCLH